MSRYTYNAGLVTQTLDQLASACTTLDSTNVDIQKGISTIYSARGAEYINADFGVITNFQSQVVEYIDLMSTEIRNKAQEIEEYESAPWYKKLFATIGLGALKIVEGLGTFLENIGDGLVSITGAVGGIFDSDFKDACAEYVKQDHVGDAFYDAYENGWLSDVNKYSAMSHTSTAANVLKGVGVAAGYVVLSVATAGAGTAVSLGTSAVAAGVGGIGSGTQSGLQAGMTFDSAFGEGLKQGAVAAGTTLVVGGLANKLGSLAKGASALDDAGNVLVSSGDDVLRLTAGATDDVINAGDDVLRATSNVADDIMASADDIINNLDDAGRAIITEGGDDAINVIGKVSMNGDDALLVANSAGGKSLVGANGNIINLGQNADEMLGAIQNAGGVVDDITNVGAQAAAAVDDVGTSLAAIDDIGTNALSIVDDVAGITDDIGTNALSVVDDVAGVTDDIVSIGDDVANAANKNPNLIQKIATKVDDAVTNFGTNTRVGQALSTAAAKAGPTVTNAIAAGTGAVATGTITEPIETSAYRMTIEEAANPSLGENLYNETTTAVENGTPSIANEAEAAQNLQNLQEQGYNPGGETGGGVTGGGVTDGGGTGGGGTGGGGTGGGGTGGGGTGGGETGGGETGGGETGGGETGGGETGGGETGGGETGGGETGGGETGGGETGGGTPNVGGHTGENPYYPGNGNDGIQVSDTLGDVSGSLSSLIGNSKTNIPTSSSPILATTGTNSKSMIPLGAGLSAAALAGIGTKAFLDKREKEKSEEDDEIQTEEWTEDTDSVNVDYSETKEDEEADYLSPTDEYAFQE